MARRYKRVEPPRVKTTQKLWGVYTTVLRADCCNFWGNTYHVIIGPVRVAEQQQDVWTQQPG